MLRILDLSDVSLHQTTSCLSLGDWDAVGHCQVQLWLTLSTYVEVGAEFEIYLQLYNIFLMILYDQSVRTPQVVKLYLSRN